MGDPYPSDYLNRQMEPFHLNLFSPGRSKDDTSTIIFDNFYKPGDTPKFLDAGKDNIAETWMAPPAFDAPDPKINIYQVNDVTLVKKFEGQYDAFSVWKPRKMDGLYPIGDIFVASESKPGAAILARPINKDDDTFRLPLYYEPIRTLQEEYNDLFWWPVCPMGFVALGIVGSLTVPQPGDFYCVYSDLCEIPTGGQWEYQWQGRDDAFFQYGYKVNDNNLWQKYLKLPFFSIGLRGDARLGHSQVLTAHQTWLLKKDDVAFWVEKPIDKIETSEIRFDLDKMVRKAQPVEIQPTFVINNSQVTQTLTRSIEYTTSKSESFERSKSTQLGVQAVMKIAAGGAEVEAAIGVSKTVTETTGKETVESKTDTIEATIEISEKSKIAVTITGKKYTAQVPWTGYETKYYSDGSKTTSKVSGLYTGVSINEISVQYGRETSLTQEEEIYGPEAIPRGMLISEEK